MRQLRGSARQRVVRSNGKYPPSSQCPLQPPDLAHPGGILSGELTLDELQADTVSLLSSSIRDVWFSQRAPQTKLEFPPKAVSTEAETAETMASNSAGANGTNGTATTTRFDPHFTDGVINAVGPKANPRMRKVMASLVRHLHDFCRENEITVDEYMAGIELINAAGKMSDDKRNETQLLLAILGTESLVDEITYKLADEANDAPTATAILGPFWRKDAPVKQMGDSVVSGFEDSPDHALVHGRVFDFATGKPIANAELDIWETAPNGLYEQQDPDQPDMNLRGRFTTGDDGEYHFYCLRPTKYPIPYDGPAGDVLQLLDRHAWRPAHIHFIISAHGYKPLVTQIFDRRSEFVGNDVAFAVKESLVVDFVPKKGDPKAQFELGYDFKLVGYENDREHGVEGATEPAA